MLPTLSGTHPRTRLRAMLATLALVIAVPANASGATGFQTTNPSMVISSGIVAGVTFVPLINVGEEPYGTIFEGIPDGIGVRPGPEDEGWVDLYVTHEQSHVPFGTTATNVFADYQDSSVSRVRIDVASQVDHRHERAPPGEHGVHPLLLGLHGWTGARLRALHLPGERGVERPDPGHGRHAVWH